MNKLELVSRVLMAGLVVWRLTRMFFATESFGVPRLVRTRPEDFLGSRVMDCLYWISVSLSAKMAIWVACGLIGVFTIWFAAAVLSRLVQRRPREEPASTAQVADSDSICISRERLSRFQMGDQSLPEGQNFV